MEGPFHNNYALVDATGSGKTIAAEIAMFRVFNLRPKDKVLCVHRAAEGAGAGWRLTVGG